MGEGFRGRRRHHRVCDRHARLRLVLTGRGATTYQPMARSSVALARAAGPAPRGRSAPHRRVRGRRRRSPRSWPPSSTPRSPTSVPAAARPRRSRTSAMPSSTPAATTSVGLRRDLQRHGSAPPYASHALRRDGPVVQRVDEIEFPDLLVCKPEVADRSSQSRSQVPLAPPRHPLGTAPHAPGTAPRRRHQLHRGRDIDRQRLTHPVRFTAISHHLSCNSRGVSANRLLGPRRGDGVARTGGAGEGWRGARSGRGSGVEAAVKPAKRSAICSSLSP